MTVIIAENKEMQEVLDIVEKGSRKKGLELKSKKRDAMVASRNNERS